VFALCRPKSGRHPDHRKLHPLKQHGLEDTFRHERANQAQFRSIQLIWWSSGLKYSHILACNLESTDPKSKINLMPAEEAQQHMRNVARETMRKWIMQIVQDSYRLCSLSGILESRENPMYACIDDQSQSNGRRSVAETKSIVFSSTVTRRLVLSSVSNEMSEATDLHLPPSRNRNIVTVNSFAN
jgi:hypothetical protein